MKLSYSLAVAVLLAALLVLPGCHKKAKPSKSGDVLDSLSQTRTDLDQAYDMLVRMDEFEREPASASIVSYLNNHLSQQKADPEWKPDPLVARLPRQLRSLPPVEKLGSLDVQTSDPLYCEEALLLRSIGNWVTKQSPSPELEAWAKSPETKLDDDQREALLAAATLFDWTVRNVQLDTLAKPPPDAVAGPSGDAARANLPAPLRGLMGPGYTALPWYVAMTGHGDAWQRMRVFTLLCRQQGIDVVTLALPDPQDENKTRPWVSAVLIGEQLYLFDAALGLPIPGPKLQGIATLEQVRTDPAILRQLDVDSDHPYDVSGDELKKSVTALIDAPLESLSQRMQIIERGLVGDRQLKLTLDASELAARVRKSPGIASVALWTVPVEALLFDLALRESPVFDPQLRFALLTDRNLIENRALVGSPRHKHLHGKFSDTLDKKGAKSNYLEARGFFLNMLSIEKPADMGRKFTEINAQFDRKSTKEVVERTPEGTKQLEYLVELNGMLEYIKEKQGEKQQLEKFGEIQHIFGLGRDECSYWLGLAHYDSGNYKAAVDWLDARTLQAAPTGRWSSGARYNVARAYEQLKANKLAQELYLADESPQQHGNLLRAKWLSGK